MYKQILFLFALPTFLCFNISPIPNVFINKPKIQTYMPQIRSSYFGYSINLRKDHVLIGSPRAQSTLEQQRKINETGAVYRCNFNDVESTQICQPYHFDLNGNTRVENTDLAYNSEKKDFQMLGFSMDGHESENNKLVVCAPKLKADLTESDHYLLHGICYWVSNTNSTQPSGVRQIIPLRQKSLQTVPGENNTHHYYYIYGESGFSVHVTEDDEEIIIGCPGILNWQGSIIRYRAGKRPDLGGLSRRDLRDDKSILHILRKRQIMEYRSEIPNPFFFTLSDDSYFGYAVSSAKFLGTEVDRLFYVASAPQANKQSGEVYVFDIEDYRFDKKIKLYNKFSGTKFGEYFGYALLCEDFNADGLPDIAISAPSYSKNGLYENGAVYILINTGNLAFVQQTILVTDYEFNGRFGTTLSKIGDINLDGYNDLIVSAPFEDDGAIYVYLGSPEGLSQKPSQRIKAPSEVPHPYDDIYKNSMFGFGLSRGVDIDGNGYRDIAVGSPNAESVYLFRTYPVVKVIASITSLKNELTLEDNQTKIKVCARYESVTPIEREIEFSTSLTLDMRYNRASFTRNEIDKVVNHSLKLTNEDVCTEYVIFVRGSLMDIFKPIIIEMKYDTAEKVSEDESTFCETCVMLDPNISKTTTHKIVFSTGCAGETCKSDLSVVGTLANVRQPFVLGSENTIAIKYEISNSGESAYLTQLKVTIPTNLTQYSRIPSTCTQDSNIKDVMTCDIHAGKPVKNGETADITIVLDATRLDGKSFKVFAEVSSAGEEQRPGDNLYTNEILLTEFSDLELNGHSSSTRLSLEDGLRIENLQYTYKIFNNGPSTIKELSLVLQVPIIYIPRPNYHISTVNFETIDVRGFYTNKVYDVTWSKDDKIWLQAQEKGDIPSDPNLNLHFDTSKLGMDYDLNNDRTQQDLDNLAHSHHRRRRSLAQAAESDDDHIFRVYNQYTGGIDEYTSSYRISVDKEDTTLMNLPKNRTIYADCTDQEESNGCIEAQFTIHNFRPGSEPISINMNFSLDLTKFDEIFNEKQNIFVYKTNTKLNRIGDESLRTLKITTRNPYTVVYEKITTSTPIWIWIVSAIVGLLILILLCYTLYRLGFFKRNQRDELQRLTRESRKITSEEAEELKNLNI